MTEIGKRSNTRMALSGVLEEASFSLMVRTYAVAKIKKSCN